ncbi:MAG: chorismate mutase [Pseudomonadota bacterium]|nr:chorismate mutase [Pseudomonadota bacterium]
MTLLLERRPAQIPSAQIGPRETSVEPAERHLAHRRAEVDCIDDAILRLIDMRLRLAERIGAAKAPDAPKRRPEREAEILARLSASREIAPESLVHTVWRALMDESLARQG